MPGTGKLGWCITGHHTDCPINITANICMCECHNKKEVINEPEKAVNSRRSKKTV